MTFDPGNIKQMKNGEAAGISAAKPGSNAMPLQDNRPLQVLQKKSANTGGVIQFTREIAQRNWDTITGYSGDQHARVIHAFNRANYTLDDINRMIVRLIDNLGYGDVNFAHGRGNSDSGTQGDTMGSIGECVDALVAWANAHPKREEEKKVYTGPKDGSGDKDKKGKKDRDGGGGGAGTGSKPMGTGHLASWITGVSAWVSRK